MSEPNEDDEPKVEVVVINLGRSSGPLPKHQTPEQQAEDEHDATHRAVHTLVDLRMLSQEIHDAADSGNTAGFDQGNAAMHDLIEHMPLNRLRNALMISVSLMDMHALSRVVYKYCGDPEGDGDA